MLAQKRIGTLKNHGTLVILALQKYVMTITLLGNLLKKMVAGHIWIIDFIFIINGHLMQPLPCPGQGTVPHQSLLLIRWHQGAQLSSVPNLAFKSDDLAATAYFFHVNSRCRYKISSSYYMICAKGRQYRIFDGNSLFISSYCYCCCNYTQQQYIVALLQKAARQAPFMALK